MEKRYEEKQLAFITNDKSKIRLGNSIQFKCTKDNTVWVKIYIYICTYSGKHSKSKIRENKLIFFKTVVIYALEYATYIKSSAASCKWKLDFWSFITDESCSFPGENSTFPKCKIAASVRNIASWKIKIKLKQWKITQRYARRNIFF